MSKFMPKVFLSLLVALSLVSCGGSANPLIGKWSSNLDNGDPAYNITCDFERDLVQCDNTVLLSSNAESATVEYRKDGNRIIVIPGDGSRIITFELVDHDHMKLLDDPESINSRFYIFIRTT